MKVDSIATYFDRAREGLIYVIGVSMMMYLLYFAYSQPLTRKHHSNIFLGLGLAMFYLVRSRNHRRNDSHEADRSINDRRFPFLSGTISDLRNAATPYQAIVTAGLALVSLIVTGYVEYHWQRLFELAQIQGYTELDYLVGLIIIALVIDATARAYGYTIPILVGIGLFYGLQGTLFPGIFYHSGLSARNLIEISSIGLDGVYGFIFGIGSTWVAIFVMFAGLARAFGLIDYILSVSREIGNVLHTGVVEVAVIGSMAMGMVTGSSAANTATTGSFTIPLMKDQGVDSDYAGGIESVASTGGQMMPPIMGATAFIMADILSISYLRVVEAALLPAFLFYLSVAISVLFLVYKFGWTTERQGSFDTSVLVKGWYFFIPFAILIYTLGVLRYSPMLAGFYTIVSTIVTVLIRNVIHNGVSSGITNSMSETVEAFEQGSEDFAPFTGILASVGIIVVMITRTGLSQKISTYLVNISSTVAMLLFLAMLASILFGMGMPTPAAYILVAILVAPGLINFGLQEITAHMFVFYFAMLSAITPPVAVSVIVGAEIAGATFFDTAKQALRIGLPGFVIPYGLVANESLLYWSFPVTILEFLAFCVGVVAISVATTGYDGKNDVSLIQRGGYVLIAIAAIFGPVPLQLVSGGLGVFLLGRQTRFRTIVSDRLNPG